MYAFNFRTTAENWIFLFCVRYGQDLVCRHEKKKENRSIPEKKTKQKKIGGNDSSGLVDMFHFIL